MERESFIQAIVAHDFFVRLMGETLMATATRKLRTTRTVWFKPENRQREYNSSRSQIFIIALGSRNGKGTVKVRQWNYQTADGDFKVALAVEMQITL